MTRISDFNKVFSKKQRREACLRHARCYRKKEAGRMPALPQKGAACQPMAVILRPYGEQLE